MTMAHLTQPIQRVYDLVAGIIPHDDLERQHKQETLAWIASGVPIFRIVEPDVPAKHLVSYTVPFDAVRSKILLVDHKKAGLKLPPGGHVDIDECPNEAAARECFEELGIQASFWYEGPFFLAPSLTVGLTAGHIDVNLWYVLDADSTDHYAFDTGEFSAITWVDLDEVPLKQSDPHMKRFIEKLRGAL